MKKIYDKVIEWLGSHSDKVLHFTVSALLALYITALLGLPGGIFLTGCIGVTKEALDQMNGGDFSWGDIAADALGIITAIIPLLWLGL